MNLASNENLWSKKMQKVGFPTTMRTTAIRLALIAMILLAPLQAQQISLQALVTPSTTISKDGRPVLFALHGFIEFKTLTDLFSYIESQTQRWKPSLDAAAQRRLAGELLRRGIESRVISMTDERPLETLITHTSEELRQGPAQPLDRTQLALAAWGRF